MLPTSAPRGDPEKLNFSPALRHGEEFRRGIQRLIERFTLGVVGTRFAHPMQLLDAFDDFWFSRPILGALGVLVVGMLTGLAIANHRKWVTAASQSAHARSLLAQLRRELTPTRPAAAPAAPARIRPSALETSPSRVRATLQALINENARLIGSVPESLRGSIAEFIAEETYKGRRAADIAEDLRQKLPDLSRSRIALIARTEASRAWTLLTQARAKDLNLAWYVWRTSKDARVRTSHRLMDGVLVSWDDPPSPEEIAGVKSTLGRYAAGSAPNCRCITEPLIDLRQVTFPAKVYRAGQIVRMTRAHFAALGGRPMADNA